MRKDLLVFARSWTALYMRLMIAFGDVTAWGLHGEWRLLHLVFCMDYGVDYDYLNIYIERTFCSREISASGMAFAMA